MTDQVDERVPWWRRDVWAHWTPEQVRLVTLGAFGGIVIWLFAELMKVLDAIAPSIDQATKRLGPVGTTLVVSYGVGAILVLAAFVLLFYVLPISARRAERRLGEIATQLQQIQRTLYRISVHLDHEAPGMEDDKVDAEALVTRSLPKPPPNSA